MSKISQYLNEHILGEVVATDAVLERFSRDGSILQVTPELVAHPKVTNDIRKIARFTWQLAEKGHVMPITVRGNGSNQTGAAIGSGIIINTFAHLNKVLYISDNHKDLFVHVQPGITIKNLNDILKSHQTHIPFGPSKKSYSTIGGSIADNSGEILSETDKNIGDLVKRLEIVLANGDLIEASRISKKELNKKKGLQTFEGEIYRKIDGIIEDNQDIIKELIANNTRENTGYHNIANVKQKDGSFDLTPLFIASQGTLGVISEIVLKTELYNNEETAMAVTFNNSEIAISAANSIYNLKPAVLELLDDKLFKRAKDFGKKYIIENDNEIPKNTLYISFNDFGEKARKSKLKKVLKILSKLETKISVYTSNDYPIDDLHAIYNVNRIAFQSASKDESSPNLIDGSSIPLNRRGEFISAVDELAKKHHVELPIRINWLNGVVCTRPSLKLHTVGDKQKVFKIINDYSKIVIDHDGMLSSGSGEGRLKSAVFYAQLDEKVVEIFEQIRNAFDPYGTLNPSVKSKIEASDIVPKLNSKYNQADFAKYSPEY